MSPLTDSAVLGLPEIGRLPDFFSDLPTFDLSVITGGGCGFVSGFCFTDSSA